MDDKTTRAIKPNFAFNFDRNFVAINILIIVLIVIASFCFRKRKKRKNDDKKKSMRKRKFSQLISKMFNRGSKIEVISSKKSFEKESSSKLTSDPINYKKIKKNQSLKLKTNLDQDSLVLAKMTHSSVQINGLKNSESSKQNSNPSSQLKNYSSTYSLKKSTIN